MKKFIRRRLYKQLQKKNKEAEVSNYQIAKAYKTGLSSLKRELRNNLFIVIGIFSASFGFKGFLLTNHFIDGGATGISLLITEVTKIPLSLLLIVINIPFVILGYKILNKQFALKTALAITGLALCVEFVDFPNITDDDLLVAVFGGFFLGAGIGFAVRGGAVIDGTEVLAIFLSRKFKTTLGDIIIAINIIIFLTAAYLLSVQIAMYSMITYLAASKTLDFFVEGIEEYIGVTIVSPHCEEIRQMIIRKMGRGVTIYQGRGGYGKRGETREIDIVYTVITRLELSKLSTEISKIDPNAFVVMNSVKDTQGGMIKKRPLQH